MKYLLLGTLCAFFAGCSNVKEVTTSSITRHVDYEIAIPSDRIDTAAKWVTETLVAAHSNADKDPEDSIGEASYAAVRLFGRPTIGIRSCDSMRNVFVPYELLDPTSKQICDDFVAHRPVAEAEAHK